MILRKDQWPIAIAYVVSVLFFAMLFLARKNYEFVMYIVVILLFGGLVLWSNKRYRYSNFTLWGLWIWAFLHMAGGGVRVGEKVLYGLILVPIVGEPYNILKYDQVIHALGFFVTTLLAYELLEPSLKDKPRWGSLGLILVAAGAGFGALNEVVEFLAVVILPETGVGGYYNTGLDLIANLIGALIAVFVIRARSK